LTKTKTKNPLSTLLEQATGEARTYGEKVIKSLTSPLYEAAKGKNTTGSTMRGSTADSVLQALGIYTWRRRDSTTAAVYALDQVFVQNNEATYELMVVVQSNSLVRETMTLPAFLTLFEPCGMIEAAFFDS